MQDQIKVFSSQDADKFKDILAGMGYSKSENNTSPGDLTQIKALAKAEGKQEGLETGKNEAMAAVKEIYDLCLLADADSDTTKKLVVAGSVENARTVLMEEKAKNAESNQVINAVDPVQIGAVNPMIEEAKRRAKEVE